MLVIKMPNATNDFIISRNVDGQFQFEIWNESSEVEGMGQS